VLNANKSGDDRVSTTGSPGFLQKKPGSNSGTAVFHGIALRQSKWPATGLIDPGQRSNPRGPTRIPLNLLVFLGSCVNLSQVTRGMVAINIA
jgi:hypothetical protein